MFSLGAVLLVSCKQNSNKQEQDIAPADSANIQHDAANEVSAALIQKATFKVEGMACAIGCAKVIENKLANLDGVKNATVDFESKKASIEFDESKQNDESIKQTVEEIANGAYKVEDFSTDKDLTMIEANLKS